MQMKLESGSRVLVAFLRTRLTVALVPDLPRAEFTQEGRGFRERGHGDLTGFYDWLRDTSDAVMGVRYWPLRETEFPREAIRYLSYVRLGDDSPSVEIFFSSRREFDPERSATQDF